MRGNLIACLETIVSPEFTELLESDVDEYDAIEMIDVLDGISLLGENAVVANIRDTLANLGGAHAVVREERAAS